MLDVRWEDDTCLHSAYREACHCAMLLLGDRAEAAIDVGNYFVQQHFFEAREPGRKSLCLVSGVMYTRSVLAHCICDAKIPDFMYSSLVRCVMTRCMTIVGRWES